MRTLDVACAIIEKEGKVLIAQRLPGDSLGGYWEFPGGKVRDGERIEQCLVREVREELGIKVRLREFLRKDSYRYPEKFVNLYFFLCDWVEGRPSRQDCLDFRWADPEEFRRYRFPLGDDAMINDLILKKNVYFGKSVRNRFWAAEVGFLKKNPFQTLQFQAWT